jgi:hypothetical protein
MPMVPVQAGPRSESSSIIAPDQIWPMGLAMPCPAMSGAEPCTGSKARSGLMHLGESDAAAPSSGPSRPSSRKRSCAPAISAARPIPLASGKAVVDALG